MLAVRRPDRLCADGSLHDLPRARRAVAGIRSLAAKRSRHAERRPARHHAAERSAVSDRDVRSTASGRCGSQHQPAVHGAGTGTSVERFGCHRHPGAREFRACRARRPAAHPGETCVGHRRRGSPGLSEVGDRQPRRAPRPQASSCVANRRSHPVQVGSERRTEAIAHQRRRRPAGHCLSAIHRRHYGRRQGRNADARKHMLQRAAGRGLDRA